MRGGETLHEQGEGRGYLKIKKKDKAACAFKEIFLLVTMLVNIT